MNIFIFIILLVLLLLSLLFGWILIPFSLIIGLFYKNQIRSEIIYLIRNHPDDFERNDFYFKYTKNKRIQFWIANGVYFFNIDNSHGNNCELYNSLNKIDTSIIYLYYIFWKFNKLKNNRNTSLSDMGIDIPKSIHRKRKIKRFL